MRMKRSEEMSETKKAVLVTALFIYLVIAGILIADLGTCSVAGGGRESIAGRIINTHSN